MKIIKDQNLYRSLIPRDSSLYLQPSWMDLFSKDWNAVIGMSDDGTPMWIRPVQRKIRFGFRKYGRIPYCPDNGPLFLDRSLTGIFDTEKNPMFSMSLIDDRRNICFEKVMKMSGWNALPRYRQFFDLRAYPNDFEAVSRSKRKRMNKNDHLVFIRFNDVNETDNLFLHSLQKSGFQRTTVRDLHNWNNVLDQTFDHFIFGIKDRDGNILSAQWLVAYEKTLYGWLAVRHPRFRKGGGREMLLWHIIQWAREHYAVYDLGGSSIPGVRQFNLEMGAREVKYNRYIQYRPEWVGLLLK